MGTLVHWEDLTPFISEVMREPVIALDLETTSLSPLTGDLFSMAIATPKEEFYLNCNPLEAKALIAREKLKPLFQPWFATPERLWVNHHIKFDLHFLRKLGLEIAGEVYCTMTMARLERNDHFVYSLEACGARIGKKKDDAVKKYADEHGLYDWETIPGKKTRHKNYHFEQIPMEIMLPYACQDARVAFDLYEHQQKVFSRWTSTKIKPIEPVIALEKKTTKILLGMESRGIRVDRDYCEKAAARERDRMGNLAEQFRQQTGKPLIDSAKALTPIFKEIGYDPGKTRKGNASFAIEILEKINHPVSKTLLEHRDAKKRLGTYFSSFLHYSQWDGRVHCNLNQAGAATGRLSASSPNLQNLTKDEDSKEFPIRRAFIADDGEFLLSADWRQMEYRRMLDLAGQMDVIEKVKRGLDFHQVCADMMAAERDHAKKINFLLIFGGGVAKLCEDLFLTHYSLDTLKELTTTHLWQRPPKNPDLLVGLDPKKVQEDVEKLLHAQSLRDRYFAALPKVKQFIDDVRDQCKARGHLFSHLGRRYFFRDPNYAYKGVNYIIQGSCADIMRIGLCDVDEKLKAFISRLLLTIHDEFILGVPEKELYLSGMIKQCLINAYTPIHLPMDASLAYGPTLHDLEEVA